MALQDSLKEICDGLCSARLTERKKNAEALKNFLTRNAVPSVLTENSLSMKGYTWNDIFNYINEYTLKELEKYESTKSFESVIKPLCTSLLHLCVAGSNKGRTYIKCEKVTEACLNILKDNRLKKAIGDAYLSLLYKYILPCIHYSQHISPSTWEELLDVSISSCLSSYSKLDNYTKLKLLLLVVTNGGNNCQFVIPLRDSLLKFKKLYLELANDKKAQEVIIEITILLLELLSLECRMSMCHLVESVMSSVFKHYDQNLDQKKKSLFFTLLHKSIVLHHPKGRLQSQEGSLADNWFLWNKHLLSMLEIIYLEVAYLHKSYKQNNNPIKHINSFYCFSASVYFQLFNQQSLKDESVSKRPKLTHNKNKHFDDIIEELRLNHIPWLGIVTVFVRDYTHYVSDDNYLKILYVIEALVTKNNNTLDWDTLGELVFLVLKNFTFENITQKEDYTNVLATLINSCIRNATTINDSHRVVHMIIQYLLTYTVHNYQNIQALTKLYPDNEMPVSDCSVKTLCVLLYKFFNKCNQEQMRMNYFTWFMQGDINCISAKQIRALATQLVAAENIAYTCLPESKVLCDNDLYDVLFNSIEDSTLFSEFENKKPKYELVQGNSEKHVEVNFDVGKNIQQYFITTLEKYIERLKNRDLELLTFMKFTNITMLYLDIFINCGCNPSLTVKDSVVFRFLQIALKEIFLSLQCVLASNTQIPDKIKLLQLVRELLESDLNPLLSSVIRLSIDDSLFHCLNDIIHTEIKIDDEDIVNVEEDSVVGAVALKHHSVYALAAFCVKLSNHRGELLELILDPKIYNFLYDIDCALQCIEILISPKVDKPPLGLLFTLMAHMCRSLYRDSKASHEILKHLIKMLDFIWLEDSTVKQNCCIMVKSYLQRCEKGYYPPNVAALIYECGTKIWSLSRKYSENIDEIFEKATLEKIKGDIHSVRLYCCYLQKSMLNYMSEEDIRILYTSMSNIYLINVTNREDVILKDESANRTSTVLHLLFVIAQTRKSLLPTIMNIILSLQKEKSLDRQLVKKVLNKLSLEIYLKNTEFYLDRNILCVLHFWFAKKYDFEDIPFYFFGYETFDMFIEKHKKWLISTYILWSKRGDLRDIRTLSSVNNNVTLESILEVCFCNILALCLPYIALEKYQIDCVPSELPSDFQTQIGFAKQMFQMTRQILPSEKWTNLFVENLTTLLLLSVNNLRDRVETQTCFQIVIPVDIRNFYYPKKIYLGILRFIRELTDGDIMLYLCKNEYIDVYKILISLWDNVANENILELKAMALHAYIVFIEQIPLGHFSDVFIVNYICFNFAYAIKECGDDKELAVYTKGLKLVVDMLLPKCTSDIVQKPLSYLLPTLVIKNEEKRGNESHETLPCLIYSMKNFLKESEDVIDFVSSLSQNIDDQITCTSMSVFMEKLDSYKLSSIYPSFETLQNMRQFLKRNKLYVLTLYDTLDPNIFAEDCGSSTVHQIINYLTTIITSATDEKAIIEACNCLTELETYNLKSLVTMPPQDTHDVLNYDPKTCFAVTVVKTLTKFVFDKNPLVTNTIIQTLNKLLKYFEDIDIFGLKELEKRVLKSIGQPTNTEPLDIKLNVKAFEKYKIINTKTFLSAFSADREPDCKDNEFDWLKQVTSSLLELIEWRTDCITILMKVCALKSAICEPILPALVGLLIYCSTEEQIQVLSEQLNMFFNYVWNETFDNMDNIASDSPMTIKGTIRTMDHSRKAVIQHMLHIVDFVLLQRNYYKSRPNRGVESLSYLKLQYDKIAWAATIVDQNVTAVYYGEMWAISRNSGIPPSSPESTANLVGGENLLKIFRKCYVSIGEMDAIEGCGTAHLTIEEEKRKHLISTGQFTDALLQHDIALSRSIEKSLDLHCGVVRSLQKSGMHHLALQYIKSLPENEDLNDIRYECLSFLGDWSGFVDTRALNEKFDKAGTNPNSVLKTLHYACLKNCLNVPQNINSQNKMTELLNSAKRYMSKLCQNLNMVNSQNVYTVISKLRLFADIEDYFSVRTGKLSVATLLNGWHTGNLPPYIDFKHLEPLISQRVLILEYASNSFNDVSNDILSLQIQYARLGLSNNRIQMAQRVLSLMKESKASEEVAFVESEISWAKGQKKIALSLLRNMVNYESTNVEMRAMSWRQYGLWMAESKYDNARDIINKYLLKSLDVLKNKDYVETTMKVYYDIAKFADTEYKQVVDYMNSTIFENKVKCLESLKGATFSLRSNQVLSRDEQKALNINEKFRQLDEAEIANTEAEKQSFLQLAMRYYLLSLKHCEENNLSVFRVLSLWLANPEFEFEDQQGDNFAESLRSIPSRKFITVLPQLAPHLTSQNTSFAKNLEEIIMRCATEHPHHTLPILFSLKNSDKDKVIMNASSAIGSGTSVQRNQEPRVVVAESMIRNLERQDSDLALIISQMDAMCNALISFANYKPPIKTQKQGIPSAELIHKLKNLNAISVPTVTLPISKECKYLNFPALHSFENYFELVGGINCPKKISCMDTSGKKRILLVKGEDDLRQDAVMQQVFNIVNNLLEKNSITSRNKLLIRTYKVVPMSRQSGVLEWCVGTMPLGAYLIGAEGKPGAHARYRPQDISCSAARKKILECHEKRKSHKEKLIVFMNILKDFKAVFHYFFTEHYLNPVTWYERRLAYTKSVSTSSMVGYILGLGDRHVQNILIDKRTGEVIHIDFGIAFDQGKTLPTPETVPFRLTQDIVAGFGSSGVEGIFRRCCEKTMQLLRDNQETLLTILDVLLCDPLYTWTLTTTQQNVTSFRNVNNQSTDSGLAKRALLTVSSKLSGTEGGQAGGVAVDGQVARLLQTAADPANLCRLFPGWQPYL